MFFCLAQGATEGLWVQSEFVAATVAILVFYLAHNAKSKLSWIPPHHLCRTHAAVTNCLTCHAPRSQLHCNDGHIISCVVQCCQFVIKSKRQVPAFSVDFIVRNKEIFRPTLFLLLVHVTVISVISKPKDFCLSSSIQLQVRWVLLPPGKAAIHPTHTRCMWVGLLDYLSSTSKYKLLPALCPSSINWAIALIYVKCTPPPPWRTDRPLLWKYISVSLI